MSTARAMHAPAEPAPVRAARLIGDAVSAVAVRIAGAGLLAIVALNGANVVGRYFFSAPIGWAEEAMLYLMILVVFSALAGVTWRGWHIHIELLVQRLPPTARRLAALASAALTIGVCGVVASSSYEVVSLLFAFDQRSDALEMPVWIPQACVLVGLSLTALLTLLRLIAFGLDPRPAGHG